VKNIFVLGLDEFNRRELASVRQAEACRFIGLLKHDEIVRPENAELDFDELEAKAKAQLDAFEGTVDGIIAFFDFPSSALAGVLRNSYGLPGPTNEAIAKCDHKYWSRIEQRAVIPELIPPFRCFDPFSDDPFGDIAMVPPFWIKPVKAHSSYLGFRIEREDDLRRHLPEMREKAWHFGKPFDQYLRHVDLPEEMRCIGGGFFVAEGIISADYQCTLEGFVYKGDVSIYGVVDSRRSGEHNSCFSLYQYPSQLPQGVQNRMSEAAAKVITRFGYDNAPFNAEFFWDPHTDEIRLLEVNARLSKSHCPLFRMVDGASHQDVLVDLALGKRPAFQQGQGDYRIAGKFMVRNYANGTIRAVPDEEEIRRVQEVYPEAGVHLLVSPGMRLDRLQFQDSYSFELAEIFLGARDAEELNEKYEHCLEMLTFDIEPDRKGAA